MEKPKRRRSLRGQMAFIILLCWLLPMALAAAVLGSYLALGLGRQTRQAVEEQFQLNLQMGADRVNSAVEASRLPSYDPEFRDALAQYRRDGDYALLYRRCYGLFSRLYQSDSRFRYGVVCLTDSPEERFLTVVGSSSGLLSTRQVQELWRGHLPVKGEAPPPAGADILDCAVRARDFTLRGRAAVVNEVLLAGFRAYPYVLGAMALSLLLLLAFTFRFFRRKISQPIQALMDGASDIQRGQWGRQIDCQAGSREFEYLTGAFNQVSARLQDQFTRLYQEELARRDAQIKALQSHINPHFLNNTLETINWQARINGDGKTSKMIEALSTVLDAALDRKGRPEVPLAEEMTYVNAYLYIVSQRFGKGLQVDIDLPVGVMDCMVPRLILQPVIENAVEHGVGPGGQGRVALRGFRREGFLILEIENNGGLPPEGDGESSGNC